MLNNTSFSSLYTLKFTKLIFLGFRLGHTLDKAVSSILSPVVDIATETK